MDHNKVLLSFTLLVLAFILLIVILKWLWNSTLPDLFGFKEITLFQAFKIFLLSLILTGGLSRIGKASTVDATIISAARITAVSN
jgi:hypothetical protein